MESIQWKAALGLGAVMSVGAVPLSPSIRAGVRFIVAAAFLTAVLVQLKRRPDIGRKPWGLTAAGGFVALLSALVRVGHGLVVGVNYPYPSPADLLAYLSYALFIAGAGALWRSRTRRNDPEALLDAFIVASAAAVLIFSSILSEYTRDGQIPALDRAGNVVYSLMTIALIGQVARLAVGPGARNTAWSLLATATLLIVANDLLLLLDTTGSPWAYDAATVIAPLAFSFATAAVLHPTVTYLATAPVHQEVRLGTGRIAMLAGALLTLPVSLIVALLRNSEPDLTVLSVGSVVLAILSLRRIVLLFQSKERLGQLEVILRESGRALLSADTGAEVADVAVGAVQKIVSSPVSTSVWIGGELAASEGSPGGPDLASEQDRVLLPIGEGGSYGEVRLAPLLPLDRSENLALQTMTAQLTQALAAIDLREATLRQRTEQRLHALVEQSSDLVLVVDLDGLVVFASPNAPQVIGRPADWLVGKAPARLCHADDAHVFALAMLSPTSDTEVAHSVELRMRRPAYEDYRWFDVTVRDFRHEPEVAGLVVTARDVTEERTAKENLQRSEAWFRSL
ncbi:MAG: PAS domain S-box protein, partial [Actinomycetia bacterium]|nr:PAS domain S-box protein [Actinomycetes bacterium]